MELIAHLEMGFFQTVSPSDASFPGLEGAFFQQVRGQQGHFQGVLLPVCLNALDLDPGQGAAFKIAFAEELL